MRTTVVAYCCAGARNGRIAGVEVDAIDGLTGAQTRRERVSKINLEILRGGATLFVARYLCVDIDNLKVYLDVEGLTAGDEKLVALAHALIEHYGRDSVYRVDGDDFVVELGDREPWIPKIDDRLPPK